MTEDNRRSQLKDWLRLLRNLRRHPPPPHPLYGDVDPDERWRRAQERREVEAELDQEDEAEAAKARRQESAAPAAEPSPTQVPEAEISLADSKPELREASDEEIRASLFTVYKRFGEGQGPNVNKVIQPTREDLKTKGLEATWKRVQDQANHEDFAKYRGKIGVRRS